jgi:hypothetical protein
MAADMTDLPINPYASPPPLESMTVPQTAPSNPWKAIARRWELLRILFNVLVGLAGLLPLLYRGQFPLGPPIIGIFFYGIAANIFYLFGPIAEMYLNWIADTRVNRILPRLMTDLLRTAFVTWLLFTVGTLFSVLLTVNVALTAMLRPN